MLLLNKALRLLVNISSTLIGPKALPVKSYNVLIKNGVNIRVYKPCSNKITYPVMVYYHGGGGVIGSIKAYDRVLKHICYHADCIIVAIEYRKAPEHKFPVALEDAYLGYNWLIDNITSIQGNQNKVILCGDSAGGNLSIGLLQLLYKNSPGTMVEPVVVNES